MTIILILLAIAAVGIVVAVVLDRPTRPPKRDEVAHLEGGRPRS